MAKLPDLQELAIFAGVSFLRRRGGGVAVFRESASDLDPASRLSRNAFKCKALYRIRQGPSWTPIHNVTSASHENRACEIGRTPVLAVDGPNGALPVNPATFFMVSGVAEYGM